MKRTFSIGFLAIYGLFSLGLSVHLHYCKGKLKQFSVIADVVTCCDDEEPGTCGFTSNCCTTDDIRIALDDEHQSPVNKQDINNIQSFAIPSYEDAVALIDDDQELHQETRGSPPTGESQLYLTLCRLTYYG